MSFSDFRCGHVPLAIESLACSFSFVHSGALSLSLSAPHFYSISHWQSHVHKCNSFIWEKWSEWSRSSQIFNTCSMNFFLSLAQKVSLIYSFLLSIYPISSLSCSLEILCMNIYLVRFFIACYMQHCKHEFIRSLQSIYLEHWILNIYWFNELLYLTGKLIVDQRNIGCVRKLCDSTIETLTNVCFYFLNWWTWKGIYVSDRLCIAKQRVDFLACKQIKFIWIKLSKNDFSYDSLLSTSTLTG